MYEKRIERLISAMTARGADAALIASPENRFFFSGFTGETGAILVTEKSRTLFVEQRYALQATMETSGLAIVNVSGGLYNSINDTIIGDGVKNVIYEDGYFTVSNFRSLERKLRYEELIPAGDLMLRLRAVKDGGEIDILREAAELTDEGYGFIRNRLKIGASEKELSLGLELFLRERGADGFARRPSVVSGVRTAMPSAISTAKELAFGDAVIVSIGLLYKGYRTDSSRTFFLGSADERSRGLYETVKTAKEAVFAAAKTGVPCSEVDKTARRVLADAGLRDAYCHSAGHGVGISARELPYINLQSGDTLCTGMTVSLGVGAYENGTGGVRITDTAMITPENAVALTKASEDLAVI